MSIQRSLRNETRGRETFGAEEGHLEGHVIYTQVRFERDDP